MPTYTLDGTTLIDDLRELPRVVGPATLTRAHLYGCGGAWTEALCEQQAREALGTDGPMERRSRSDLHDTDWSGIVQFLDGGRVRKDGFAVEELARSRSTDAFASLFSTSCRVCRGSGTACGPMQHFDQGGETYFAPLTHPCAECGATGRI